MASLHRMCPLEEPDIDSPAVHTAPISPAQSDTDSIAPLECSLTESEMDTDMEGIIIFIVCVRVLWLMELYACLHIHVQMKLLSQNQ